MVCRENAGSAELTPTLDSADILCAFANTNGDDAVTNRYHRTEWVEFAGNGYQVDGQFYSSYWSQDLPQTLKDVACWYNTTAKHYSCSHNEDTADCIGNYTKMAAISCGCNSDYYRTDEGCFKCPSNSYSNGFQSECACDAGYYKHLSSCMKCEENTYSLKNSASCTPCPEGTTGGVDGAEGPDWCNSTCSSESVEIAGLCIGNTVLGVIVVGVAAVGFVLVAAWKFYKRCQVITMQRRLVDTVANVEMRRNAELAARARPRVEMNILVVENRAARPPSAPKELCVLDGKTGKIYVDEHGREVPPPYKPQ